jgi:hypothetical protein
VALVAAKLSLMGIHSFLGGETGFGFQEKVDRGDKRSIAKSEMQGNPSCENEKKARGFWAFLPVKLTAVSAESRLPRRALPLQCVAV